MLTVVIIMSAGIAIGHIIRTRKLMVKITDKLTMWSIFLLLFLLGIAIGANEVIVKNLPKLGLQALAISIGGVTGSVLLAWLAYHIWFKTKTKGNEE